MAQANTLVKNIDVLATTTITMVPGTPAQPARPGYYNTETQQICGWQYAQPGHWVYFTDERTGVTTRFWVYDGVGGGVGGNINATWVCDTQSISVYHPPTPAVPATPPSYYPNTTYRTGYNLGWNSGARSILTFAEDANVQFQAGVSNVGTIVGMNIDDGTPVTYNGNTINYGFYLARGVYRIIQNGTITGGVTGTYNNDTVFRIERTADAIAYVVDDTTVYDVASGAATGEGWLEAAMYSGNDIVFNPQIQQITSLDPEDYAVTSTLSVDLPYLTPELLAGDLCVIDVEIPGMTQEISAGLSAPSYCVIDIPLSIFGADIFVATGELASIDMELAPMTMLSADHAYSEINMELSTMYGELNALEGNTHASFLGNAFALSDMVCVQVLIASFYSSGQLADFMTVDITLSAEMYSTATMEFILSQTSVQRAIMMSVARARDSAVVPGDNIETWVINLDSSMHGSTQYTNYNFNSYAEINGRYYGASAEGLVLLEGDTDLGSLIRSKISLGKQGGDSPLKKTWEQCYLGVSAAGNLFVKIIAEGNAYIYKTRDYDPELQTQRATFGKGLRTNYVTLEIYNENGSDFELDSVQFTVADLTRKI